MITALWALLHGPFVLFLIVAIAAMIAYAGAEKRR